MSDYPGLDHVLAVTISDEGVLDFRIKCTAPEGAECRLTCSEHCYEFGFEAHEHPLVDYGMCLPLIYIENMDGVPESYSGPTVPLVSGPVVLTYHSGDYYVTWSYPDSDESHEVSIEGEEP